MFKRTAPAFAAGAVFTVLVAGTGAVAATGGAFILGKTNTASKTTAIKSNSGPALAINGGGPVPFTVNSSGVVTRLNADLVDGKSASSFAPAGGRTWSYDYYPELLDLDEDGVDDAMAGIAYCPDGSQMTGGGVTDYTNSGWLVASAPDSEGDEGWYGAISIDENQSENIDNFTVSVTCWSPTGRNLDPGYGYRQARKSPPIPPGVMKRLAAKVATR